MLTRSYPASNSIAKKKPCRAAGRGRCCVLLALSIHCGAASGRCFLQLQILPTLHFDNNVYVSFMPQLQLLHPCCLEHLLQPVLYKLVTLCTLCCSFSKHLAFPRHLYLLDGRHLAAFKPLTGQHIKSTHLTLALKPAVHNLQYASDSHCILKTMPPVHR